MKTSTNAPDNCKCEVEIRLRDDKSLDEVCAKSADAHLERMGKDHWYLGIGDVQIWFHSKKKITVNFEDSRSATTTKPGEE